MAHKQPNLDLGDSDASEGPVECLGMTFEDDEARREHFLGILREKLKDPEFRKIEGFPIGEDEDILALSDPPYYTACPNPFIEDFIRHYGKPYDPETDDYHREPFAADVSEGRSGLVYDAHTYHTKVPHTAVMRYILHYTDPGDVVLDPFCGTGMTGIAASLSDAPAAQLGEYVGQSGTRRAIVADLCPAATGIAGGYTVNVAPDRFRQAASELLDSVDDELGWVYWTEDDGGNPEELIYAIHSDVFGCADCGGEIVFWDAAYDADEVQIHDEFDCPHCGAQNTKRTATRLTTSIHDPLLGATVSVPKQTPVVVSVRDRKGRRYERSPNQADADVLRRVHSYSPPYPYPTNRMMNSETEALCWGDKWRAGTSSFQHVSELYTRRNLLILAALYAGARRVEDTSLRLSLMFLISSYNLAHSNKMARIILKQGSRKPVLTGYQSGTLYASSLSVEKNVLHGLRTAKLQGMTAVRSLGVEGVIVSTQSATDLSLLPDDSVDYVFTDPPFGDNLAYAELNFVSEAWCGVFTRQQPEAIVSKHQGKDITHYGRLMEQCFRETCRTLKPGRWLTVEFHNSRNAVWNAIQEALMRAGLVVADVRTLDKQQAGFNAINAAGAVKQDLIISAYKPNQGLEGRFALEAGTEEGVWDFVRTHLRQLPVFVVGDGQAEVIAERQDYLLFDRMVAFHVQRGVTIPMSASEFYAGLRQRFPERDGMFFLPEQVSEYDKKRLTAKEVRQLQLFVTDESSSLGDPRE